MGSRSSRRRRPSGVGLTVAALLYAGFLIVLPLAALLLGVIENSGPTLRVLASSEAMGALSRTIGLTTTSLVINLVLGVLTAVVLVRDRFVGRDVLGWFTDLPLAMSPITIGLAFFVIVGRNGWLQPWLEPLDIKLVFSFPGMLLATLFVTFPFVVRETVLVLSEVGTSEEEAAATLGANPWQTFTLVTLPNILPGIAGGAALLVARALGEFGAVLVIGGAISGVTDTATTFVFHAVEERQLFAAYGMSMVLVALSVTAMSAFNAISGSLRR